MTWKVWLTALACILFLWFISSSQAATIEKAYGIFCDSEEQIKTVFDGVFNKNKPLAEALKEVNAGNEVPACALGVVAISDPVQVSEIHHNGKIYGIFRVSLLGFMHEGKWKRLEVPSTQYGMKPLEDKSA